MIRTDSENVRAISVQLGPGEDVCRALTELVERDVGPGAAVVSAVGSLSEVSYVLVTAAPDGRPAYSEARRHEGMIEVLGLQGHIGWMDNGAPAYHFHGVFGLSTGEVVGGHLVDARVLITFEATLVVASGTRWNVVPYGAADHDLGDGVPRQMKVFVPAEAGPPTR